MIIKKVDLEIVIGVTSEIPETDKPEIAFAGKSNVGKSSLINALMFRKSYARISAQPGKTQTVNFYNINDVMFLVDLPGYGYANANEEVKAKWGKMIEKYLINSSQLQQVFLLIDIRHDPSINDRIMYDWVVSNGFRPVIIATKVDKLNRSQVPKHVKMVRDGLGLRMNDVLIPFSATTKQGLEELWKAIDGYVLDEDLSEAAEGGEMTEIKLEEVKTEVENKTEVEDKVHTEVKARVYTEAETEAYEKSNVKPRVRSKARTKVKEKAEEVTITEVIEKKERKTKAKAKMFAKAKENEGRRPRYKAIDRSKTGVKPKTEERGRTEVKPKPEFRSTFGVKPKSDERSRSRVKPNTEDNSTYAAKPMGEDQSRSRGKPRTEVRSRVGAKPKIEERGKAKPKTEERGRAKPKTEKRGRAKAKTEESGWGKPRSEERGRTGIKPKTEDRGRTGTKNR